jgi:hypothetical protein
MSDLKFALRQLWKHKGSSLFAILILALGIGWTTAVYSVADKVMLNPIPGRGTDRLVSIREVNTVTQARWQVSPPLIEELAAQTNLVESLTHFLAFHDEKMLRVAEKNIKLKAASVAPNLFELLELRPLLGSARFADREADTDGPEIVLGYGFWQRHYGGDRQVVGRGLELDGIVHSVIGVLFGTAPAWLATRINVSRSLKESARQHGCGVFQRLFHDGLIVTQVSLAVVLLLGAGVMTQSVVKLLRVEPGLEAKGLYRVYYDATDFMNQRLDHYEAAIQRGLSHPEAIQVAWQARIERFFAFQRLALERLQAVPGIESAAVNGGNGGFSTYEIEDRPEVITLHGGDVSVVHGDYLRTVKARLISGRLLDRDDAAAGQQSVVINHHMAEVCWPGQNPLGKRFRRSAQSMNDLKFAFRQLLKNPGFTAVAVLTLTLGIGANTAVLDQRLKSIFRWARISLSKSRGKTPRRPVITRVLRVQSLSARTTEGALRRVRSQEGCVGSTATPKRGNLPADSVVMKANTKSPGDSASARTTQGRRFVPDKSVNGKAASTMSPTCGMSAEIGVLVPRFNIGVGIEVRLRREKVKGPADLCDLRQRFAGPTVVPWLRDDERQLRKPAQSSFRWHAHDARFIHLNRQRFHDYSLQLRTTV